VLFFVINWLKLPGYMAAGLLDASMVRVVPFAALIWPGVAAGRWLVQRVPATVFERAILALLVLGAIYLLRG
jgi:uncharacterized membrane protein YfcA